MVLTRSRLDVVEVAGFDAGLHEAVAFAADARNARSDFAAEALRAAEVEPAAIGVDAVEADVVEVAGFDARLHVAVTAEALGAAEIEAAAVGVDAVEADAVEIAAADG